MINDVSILIECWADTILIETLVPPRRGYNHCHSCFKVGETMRRGKLKDTFALGIIDDDKKRIAYLEEFEECVNHEGGLRLWTHKIAVKPHYFIQFSPALEKWILNVCDKGGIDLLEYGLSNDLKGLKKYTKHLVSRADDTNLLRNLFSELKRREDIADIRKLKAWIKILKEKNYTMEKDMIIELIKQT